jgi:sodium-dependent phosphate transporter
MLTIVPITAFNDDPYVLMLLMVCALIASSTWLMFATYIGLPVSTTHCIVGAITGGGIAALGWQGPNWGWSDGQGIAAIIASWFIAPLVAGGFAVIIYLITKYAVLVRKNPLRNGLIAMPMYFGLTLGILTMMIVWKYVLYCMC